MIMWYIFPVAVTLAIWDMFLIPIGYECALEPSLDQIMFPDGNTEASHD